MLTVIWHFTPLTPFVEFEGLKLEGSKPKLSETWGSKVMLTHYSILTMHFSIKRWWDEMMMRKDDERDVTPKTLVSPKTHISNLIACKWRRKTKNSWKLQYWIADKLLHVLVPLTRHSLQARNYNLPFMCWTWNCFH